MQAFSRLSNESGYINLTKRSNAAILGFGACGRGAEGRPMDESIAKPTIREGNERAILAAAESVFAEHGFGGATMAAIAARAGVPKANIHYYFPNKQRLYRAVVERGLTAWLDAALS